MANIFISYSRTDVEFARRLAESLSDLGADVWIDVDDIPAGMNWSNAIQQGLDEGDLMILVLSPESMGSENVQQEWQYYVDEKKPIIPVLNRPTKVHFQIKRLQYVDFHKKDYDTSLKQLHSELKRKGITLKPISTITELSDTTLPQRPQVPLPVRSEGKRQWWLPAGIVTFLLVLVIAAAALLMNGDDDPNDPTQAAELTDSPSDTATDEPSQTPTDRPSLTPTDEPTTLSRDAAAATLILDRQTQTAEAANLTATVEAWIATYSTATESARQTATVESWTDTPTNTSIPSETPTNTQAPTITPSYTPTTLFLGFEPVTRNADWTPIEQDFDGVTMVLVPAGCFMMGSEDGAGDEKPVHEQCFDAPFWIDKYEVTQAQFVQLGGEKASDNYFSGDNRPVENITWYEARAFCHKRGARLPTEREWEYAARGPDNLTYPWGNDFVGDNVVYSENSGGETAEVGSRPAGVSWVGAMDMSGNVWEWFSTIYGIYDYDANEFTSLYEYSYQAEDGRESFNIDNTNMRVLRGGSWNGYSDFLRAPLRGWFFPTGWNDYGGVRCSRSY